MFLLQSWSIYVFQRSIITIFPSTLYTVAFDLSVVFSSFSSYPVDYISSYNFATIENNFSLLFLECAKIDMKVSQEIYVNLGCGCPNINGNIIKHKS